MRRFTHALAALYALTACGLIRCAYTSSEHGSWTFTAFFAGAAILFATAIVHHAYQRDELRAAHTCLERASRPPGPTSAEDGVVAVAMAAWCCDAWAATAGAEHDPEHCTRKGHHA